MRARREALGWYQADLAKVARTHATYISRLEAGKVNPSLDVIVDIAFALGMNVATLTADILPRERRRRRRGKPPVPTSAMTTTGEAGAGPDDSLEEGADPGSDDEA